MILKFSPALREPLKEGEVRAVLWGLSLGVHGIEFFRQCASKWRTPGTAIAMRLIGVELYIERQANSCMPPFSDTEQEDKAEMTSLVSQFRGKGSITCSV